jgi:hypothetical protein
MSHNALRRRSRLALTLSEVTDASADFGSRTSNWIVERSLLKVRDLDNRLDGGSQRWYTASL